MSLKSILNDSDRSNLKEWFKFNFPNPGFKDKINIIVNPKKTESSYTGEIGTAFDYLFRFNLERINKDSFLKKSHWIAEMGFNSILNEINRTVGDNMTIGYYEDKVVNKDKFRTNITKEFEAAKSNYNKFLIDGKITMNLLKSTIILAKLDLKIRIKTIDKNFDRIEKDKLNELKELYDIVPWDKFKSKEYCSLNPYFGEGSCLVGGADADLIIDDTLIDIKTNINFKLDRSDLNQVIGYYILSIIEKSSNQMNQYLSNNHFSNSKTENIIPEINTLGIYFARFGYLWEKPLTDYYELGYYEKLADEFTQLVEDKNLELTIKKNNLKNLENQFKTPNPKNEYVIDENDFKCPYCGSKRFKKNGQASNINYYYKCKDCDKNFKSKFNKTYSYIDFSDFFNL